MTGAANRTGLRVLFSVAAGPRLGFGHLVRARSLARALGVPFLLSLRGSPNARRTALHLGAKLVDGTPVHTLARIQPELVVVDDPCARASSAWCDAARRHDVPIASVHDLGLALCPSLLAVDGSLTVDSKLRSRAGVLLGPRYAVLDPELHAHAAGIRRTSAPTVLIALGGGPRADLANHIARDIRRRRPDADIRVAAGAAGTNRDADGITWLPWLPTLAGELAACTLAVVAGGVTLYEACALGAPCVAIAVVQAQQPTVHAFATAGLALDGGLHSAASGSAGAERLVERVTRHVQALLSDTPARARLAHTASHTIDGLGAVRVAAALRHLVSGSSRRAA